MLVESGSAISASPNPRMAWRWILPNISSIKSLYSRDERVSRRAFLPALLRRSFKKSASLAALPDYIAEGRKIFARPDMDGSQRFEPERDKSFIAVAQHACSISFGLKTHGNANGCII